MIRLDRFKQLNKNWGERADSLQVKVQLRLYDDVCPTEIFVFARDDITGQTDIIVKDIDGNTQFLRVPWHDILNLLQSELMKLDDDFVPIYADQLLKNIREKYGYKKFAE